MRLVRLSWPLSNSQASSFSAIVGTFSNNRARASMKPLLRMCAFGKPGNWRIRAMKSLWRISERQYEPNRDRQRRRIKLS
jgi:hypothetical protein